MIPSSEIPLRIVCPDFGEESRYRQPRDPEVGDNPDRDPEVGDKPDRDPEVGDNLDRDPEVGDNPDSDSRSGSGARPSRRGAAVSIFLCFEYRYHVLYVSIPGSFQSSPRPSQR